MSVLVFGSLNIDRVYSVEHLVRPGETVPASGMRLFAGGKGLNQAVAFARAGSKTHFAGAVGEDGEMLIRALQENGVDCSLVKRAPGASGHAVIQVDRDGRNSIVILSGANALNDENYIDFALAGFGAGDLIMLQNEISNVPLIIEKAHEKGLTVALNPSPFSEEIAKCDMNSVDHLVLNETEGRMMSGFEAPDRILEELHRRFERLNILLTLGEDGSVYLLRDGSVWRQGIFETQAVDTTAAGDTFAGYFFTALMGGASPEEALRLSALASSIAVSRPGASPSIPFTSEVREALKRFR